MKRRASLPTVLFMVFAVGGVAWAEIPRLYPNHQKYRDTGAKPAIGRSGSAELAVQALVDVNHVATLELVSGKKDGPQGIGNIDKVQVKLTSGARTWTQNHNNLSQGASFQTEYAGLGHGEPIQVQANISGIDPKRTDVVSAQTEIKFRPDLTIAFSQPPAQALVNVPVNISALVTERNGDVSAEGQCVLSMGDTIIDQTGTISVNAGDSVECALAYTFTTPGLKQLRVTIANVVPGDYDTSNNFDTMEIEITDEVLPFNSYTATATQTGFRQTIRSTGPNREETFEGIMHMTTAGLSGQFGPLDFSTTTVSVKHFSGSIDEELFFDLGSSNQSGNCFVDSSVAGHWIFICPSSFQTRRNGGTVTFHSYGWDSTYLLTGSGEFYTWNTVTELPPTGAPGSFGSTYDIHVRISDGENTYEAKPSIPLTFSSQFLTAPPQCSESANFGGHYCTEISALIETLSGTVVSN